MRALSALGLWAAVVLGAACAEPAPQADPKRATGAAILGGDADTDDTAVVELEITKKGVDGYEVCTATFVSTTVLVTAAHCVVAADAPTEVASGASFRVLLGAVRGDAKDEDWLTVDPANVHPNPSYTADGADDIAVLVLDAPADVKPLPLLRSALDASSVGSAVRIVGYGQGAHRSTSADAAESRRSLMSSLKEMQEKYLVIGETGKQGCGGDAGGPALVTVDGVEMIAGVDALPAEKRCEGGEKYQRIDAELEFLAAYVKDDGTVAPAPKTKGADQGDDDDDTTEPAPAKTLDGAAIYEANCTECHTEKHQKRGQPLEKIQAAIEANKGGMGKLKFLTVDELSAISALE